MYIYIKPRGQLTRKLVVACIVWPRYSPSNNHNGPQPWAIMAAPRPLTKVMPLQAIISFMYWLNQI